MTEQELINLYWDRKEEAVSVTQSVYGRLIRSILGNMLSLEEDVEECENDTYLQLWNSIPPEKPMSFKAFACRLARHMGLRRIEKESAKKRSAEISDCYDELEASIISEKPGPEQLFDGKILGSAISDFLYSKPLEKRIMFVKRYWLFESVEDIAKEMGIGYSKVNTTLFRIRQELKAELERKELL